MTPTSPATMASSPAPAPAPEPTHGCARCGRPVAIGIGLCEECNPLGLRDVSASQVHGTVVVTVLVGFVILAVLARLALSGLGPFPASVDDVVAARDGLAVTLTVTNEGSASGQTTCRIIDPRDRGVGASAFVLSPQLEPGQTRTFTKTITELGTEVRTLIADCRAP